MKNLGLHLVLFVTLLLSCQNKTSNRSRDSSSAYLTKIVFLIYNVEFHDYPEKGKSLTVDFFILNNSSDTLKYTSTGCLFSKFYCIDNTDLSLVNNPFRFDSIKRVVVLPHKGKYATVHLKFNTVPDFRLKFRIGMKLARWHPGDVKEVLTEIAREKQDTVWSNTKVIKINKDHQKSDQASEQYEASILKNVFPFFFSPLTGKDKGDYVLSIDQGKINELRILKDTVLKFFYLPNRKQRKYFYTICELKLHNSSDDTLKYFSMSCSWLEQYKTDNADFTVPEEECFHNVPNVRTIPPRQSSTVKIPIVTNRKATLPKKIRIGLSLQKVADDNIFSLPFGLIDSALKPQKRSMLWSNEVTIR